MLFLIFFYLILQNGLYLDNLHISNIYAKKIYIKLDNKLNIFVDKLIINPNKNKNSNIDVKQLNSYLQEVAKVQNLFHTISIAKIEAKNFSGTFQYTSNKNSFFNFKLNNNIDFESKIAFSPNTLTLTIKKLQNRTDSFHLTGKVVIDMSSIKQYCQLDISINHDANLTLYAISNQNFLKYSVISHNSIKDIKSIISLIPLNKHIKYWAHDAIEVNDVDIYNVYGKIYFNKLNNIYKDISLNAVAHHLIYKYNPKLAPIVTTQTLLKFRNGVFQINPIKAYTYNTYLKNSWLKIDFTKKDELLDIYLMLDGQVNDNILYLLSTYKIKLPFKQNSGLVDTNLHLNIDLRTLATNVKGTFVVKQANIDYLGLNLDIFHSKIYLNNRDIIINKMQVKYQNIIDTNIKVNYNVVKNIGNINLYLKKVQYKGLALTKKSKPLNIIYKLTKKKHNLTINKSTWSFKNQNIILNKFTMPFDIDDQNITIPPVMLQVGNIAKSFISGNIDLNTSKINLSMDLFSLNYGGIILDQTNIPFQIKYDNILTVNALDTIYLRVDGSQYKIKDLRLQLNDKNIKLKKTTLDIGHYIHTKMYAKYLYNSNKISFSLNDFKLTNAKTKKVYYNNKKILLQAYFSDKNITVNSNELNAKFYSDKNIWKLDLYSLDRIAKNSKILKNLAINNGEISFYKNSNENATKFNATIIYPLSLTMNKNKKIKKYSIKGKITQNQKIDLNINQNIKINIDKKIIINAKDVGINIHEFLKLVKNIKNTESTSSSSNTPTPNIYLNATNSYIYLGKDRYALSDKIYLQYINKVTTAQLLYKKGKAGFRLKDNQFYLYGRNFNDKFMENLSAFSKFKGGTLDFSMSGKFNDYDGVFYLNKTTMIDYKLLNNVLAFVNTVPSLVTFSLPDYNKNGLYLKKGYLNFKSKNNIFTISDFYLESKELKILGKGTANLNKDTIDLTLNLKTDLGSDISKIPLVGYIIFDGQSLSTTLKINGKLSDPKVQTQIAQDIAVAPLNIIKRTLTLPYMLIKKAVTDVNTSMY